MHVTLLLTEPLSKGGFPAFARSSSQLAASTRMNVIPFPPHARLGSGGKSSKFKMALSKKQLLLLHVVIAKSTKKTYQIFKTVLGLRPIFQTRAQLSEIFTLVKKNYRRKTTKATSIISGCYQTNLPDYLHNLVKPLISVRSPIKTVTISIFSSLHLAALLKTNYHVTVSRFMIGLLLRSLAASKK